MHSMRKHNPVAAKNFQLLTFTSENENKCLPLKHIEELRFTQRIKHKHGGENLISRRLSSVIYMY